MDDHRHPEAYKEWITSITDTFRSIPGIGLYMSRQLARSCCLRFAPANLDLETLKSLDPDQGGHLAAEVGDHRKHPLDAAAEVDHHREHPLEPPLGRRRWAVAAGPSPLKWIRCMPPLGWVAAGRRRIPAGAATGPSPHQWIITENTRCMPALGHRR